LPLVLGSTMPQFAPGAGLDHASICPWCWARPCLNLPLVLGPFMTEGVCVVLCAMERRYVFFLFMGFTMINIFLAIIMDSYAEVVGEARTRYR
jgi:hypothetical protein